MTEFYFRIDRSEYRDPNANVGPEPTTESVPEPDDPFEGAPPPKPQPPMTDEEVQFYIDTERKKYWLKVSREATRRLDAEEREEFVEPTVLNLEDFLQEEDKPVRYKVDQLWPIGGNVLFAAAAKFGKSTIMMNLIRSLADGVAFLDHFMVDPIPAGEKILLVDFEMNPDRVRSELRAQGIRNVGCVEVANLRGRAKQFDLQDPIARAYWVERCHEQRITTLILDPLAPILGFLAIDENDNSSINRFFQQLDEFKADAGIENMIVTHHCGHTGDWRPRGASRFNDWPDAIWVAKIDGDITDPASPRLFFARGRDVGESFTAPGVISRVPSNLKKLTFDPDGGGSSSTSIAIEGAIESIVYLHPGQNRKFIMDEFIQKNPTLGMSDTKMKAVLNDLVSSGRLHGHGVDNGARGKNPVHYWVPENCQVIGGCPDY